MTFLNGIFFCFEFKKAILMKHYPDRIVYQKK